MVEALLDAYCALITLGGHTSKGRVLFVLFLATVGLAVVGFLHRRSGRDAIGFAGPTGIALFVALLC